MIMGGSVGGPMVRSSLCNLRLITFVINDAFRPACDMGNGQFSTRYDACSRYRRDTWDWRNWCSHGVRYISVVLILSRTDPFVAYGRTYQPTLRITERGIWPIFRRHQSFVPLLPPQPCMSVGKTGKETEESEIIDWKVKLKRS